MMTGCIIIVAIIMGDVPLFWHVADTLKIYQTLCRQKLIEGIADTPWECNKTIKLPSWIHLFPKAFWDRKIQLSSIQIRKLIFL